MPQSPLNPKYIPLMLFFSRCSSSMSCFPRNREESVANRISSRIGGRTFLVGFLPFADWRILLACVLLPGQFASASEASDVTSIHEPTRTQLLALPLQFEANSGQTDSQLEFFSRGPGYT